MKPIVLRQLCAPGGMPEELSQFPASDATSGIHDDDQFLTEVPRTAGKPLARFKVCKLEPSRIVRWYGGPIRCVSCWFIDVIGSPS